jgi:RAB protein geranylgeranyltransferase component A
MQADDTIFFNKTLEVKEDIPEQIYRQFSLDLQPKILYNIGDVVDLLLRSGVAKYMEFKSVKSGIIWNGEAFE